MVEEAVLSDYKVNVSLVHSDMHWRHTLDTSFKCYWAVYKLILVGMKQLSLQPLKVSNELQTPKQC